MSKLYKMIHCPVCCCCTVTREGETYTCAACDEQWQMVTPELLPKLTSELTSDEHKLTDTTDMTLKEGKPRRRFSLDEKTREDLLENDDSFFS